MLKKIVLFTILACMAFCFSVYAQALNPNVADGVIYHIANNGNAFVNYNGSSYIVVESSNGDLSDGKHINVKPTGNTYLGKYSKVDPSTGGKIYSYSIEEDIDNDANVAGFVYCGWAQDKQTGKWYYGDNDGYCLTNTVTPDGYTVGADGVWDQSIPQKAVANASAATADTAASNAAATTGGDYGYLATADFRSIKRQYPQAQAVAGYALPFTNLDGNQCVMVYVKYKIINDYDTYILHNLTTGDVIENPGSYYQKKAKRYVGKSASHYLKLAGEAMEKQMAITSGTFVDAATMNQ